MVVPAGLAFTNFALVAIFVAVLYFTREIVAPIALAVLLSFVLAPLVRLLQRWQLPKSLAVIFAVLSALTIASGLAAMVTIEVTQLGNDLPRYETTLGAKIHKLRDNFGSAGLFKNASNLLKDLDKDLKASDRGDGKDSPSDLTNGDARKAPIPVEIHRPEPGASEALLAVLKPLVSPFTTIGIVVIFLAFFLFQREDLRNRFIRLAGSNDLERTTSALDDAGRRLSRLFMTQLILNAVFGAVIGLGLAIIGVPNAPLWGLLAMALRFVPYIGAVMAAAFPIVLAAAVGDGWTMTVWTVALFAVVEPLMGQVVEPFVCGRSAGLSPVAVVVAASFWTWLWGPLGLLLSTPLTLCLVVLARHVERLGRLDDCAVLVVADALKREGINARAAGATTAIEDDKAASVCICYLQDVSKARLDYTVRKLSRKASAARIMTCLLSDPKLSEHSASQHDKALRSLTAIVAAFANP